MQLSVTLRSPLDQYVDDYFGSKVKDLATAFNLPETDIVYVLEFGCREIKRAPSRRSSSRESDPAVEPAATEQIPPVAKESPAPKKIGSRKMCPFNQGSKPQSLWKGCEL